MTFKKHIRAFVFALCLGVGATLSYSEPMPEPSAQMTVATQAQVRVLPGQIEITITGDENRDVTIYALTGQVVKNLTATPGINVVDLPKGYYIVKCDRVSTRVIVK